MIAAIGALIEAAFARAANYRPRFPFQVRHPGVDDARVARLQLNVHRSNAVGHEQYFLPGIAAIGSFEHTAFGVRLERISHRCYPDDVWISCMYANRADLAGIVQTNELPGLTAI